VKIKKRGYEEMRYVILIIASFVCLVALMVSSGCQQKSEETLPSAEIIQPESASEKEYISEEWQQMDKQEDETEEMEEQQAE
jgi:hypothetical protein